LPRWGAPFEARGKAVLRPYTIVERDRMAAHLETVNAAPAGVALHRGRAADQMGGVDANVKAAGGAPRSILVDADQGVAVVAFGADGLDGGGGYARFGGDEFVHAAYANNMRVGVR
jgi:hypothetical protein